MLLLIWKSVLSLLFLPGSPFLPFLAILTLPSFLCCPFILFLPCPFLAFLSLLSFPRLLYFPFLLSSTCCPFLFFIPFLRIQAIIFESFDSEEEGCSLSIISLDILLSLSIFSLSDQIPYHQLSAVSASDLPFLTFYVIYYFLFICF